MCSREFNVLQLHMTLLMMDLFAAQQSWGMYHQMISRLYSSYSPSLLDLSPLHPLDLYTYSLLTSLRRINGTLLLKLSSVEAVWLNSTVIQWVIAVHKSSAIHTCTLSMINFMLLNNTYFFGHHTWGIMIYLSTTNNWALYHHLARVMLYNHCLKHLSFSVGCG